jgi:hypothetical protein
MSSKLAELSIITTFEQNNGNKYILMKLRLCMELENLHATKLANYEFIYDYDFVKVVNE